MNNNIRAIRKARNLTQKELADRLGCTYGAVSNYERAVRALSYETLLKISEALECSVDDLVNQQLVFEPKEMPISDEERELIEMYRKLCRAYKERVFDYTRFTLAQQK